MMGPIQPSMTSQQMLMDTMLMLVAVMMLVQAQLCAVLFVNNAQR